MKKLLVKEHLPEVLEELKFSFEQDENLKLLKQLETLEINELCDCGNPDCGSFFTDQIRNDDIQVDGIKTKNGLLVEVYQGNIHYVEVMPSPLGRKIREKIIKIFKK